MAHLEWLLAEDVLLLVTEDEKGGTTTEHADVVVAGALLADLAEAGCLVETDKLVSVAPDASVDGPPVLVEALDVLRQRDQPVKAKKLLEDLRKQLKPVSDRVAERLVELGVLELRKATFLKIHWATRRRRSTRSPSEHCGRASATSWSKGSRPVIETPS